MNKNQLIAMWIGVTIVTLMVVCPPWMYVNGGYTSGLRGSTIRSGPVSSEEGYGFIFWPPENANTIDTTRLALQCFIVAVIDAAAIWSLKSKKE